MKKLTLEDYQNMPSSAVYLAMVVEKVPSGRIPPASICVVVKINHVFIRVDQEKVIDSRRFYLTSTRPISDFYPKVQYDFYMKNDHVAIEFKDPKPYECYIDYAGKSFDKYVARLLHR